MKIKNKMLLSFGLLMSVLFITVMLVLSLITKGNIEDNLEFQLNSTEEAVMVQVRGFIDASVKSYLRGVAEQNLEILSNNAESEDSVKSTLEMFGKQKIGTSGYTYVLNTNGIIVSHPDPSKIGGESTFAASLKEMTSYKDEYLRYEFNGRIKVLYRTYYKPLNWFISVTANEDELTDLIDMDSLKGQLSSIKIGTNGYPLVLNNDNKMLIHPTIAYGSDLSNVKSADGVAIFKNMIETKEGMIFYNWTENDGSVQEKFMNYKSITSPDWIIGITGYKDDYFAFLDAFIFGIIFLSAISIIVIIIFVYVISALLVKSISTTSLLLKDISQGQGDLTQKLDVKSNDEVGSMAKDFNSFTENLSTLINNVKDASITSVGIKQDLSANFEETVSSLSQVDSNLQNVNNQMQQMDEKVNDSNQAVNQILNGMTTLDSQIQEQAGAVEESTASVTEMVASLKSVSQIVEKKREAAQILVETSRQGGEYIELTNTSFEQGISANINEISEMTGIIENIASQTNLLSMNAAIEAAHAGDSGKGFAVVADEIRKLAEESTANSKKISDIINTIVQYIEKTGNHVKDTAKAFVSIESEVKDLDTALIEILNASQELSTGGEEVLSAMTILSEISSSVTRKSTDIKDNSDIVTGAINEVSHISREVSNAVNEAASGTAEINKNMNTSQNLIVDLGEATVKVNSEVGRFKTS